MELLGSVPTVWDTTIVLDAQVGDYIVTARKKGNEWFVAAMADWTARELTIPLNFLEEGNHVAEICSDGINADRYPSDYIINKSTLTNKQTLTIKMSPGGGFLARIRGN